MSNNILSIMNQTSYNSLYYQKIINFFSKNFSSNSNSKIYLINRSILNERIFAVKYELPVNYNNSIINVSLLIYLPSNFPSDIEFYLEKKANIVVSNNYSDELINRHNLRINLDFFCNWDRDKLNFSEIIETLKFNFNKSFPVFKNINSFENFGGCCVLENNYIIMQDIHFGNNYNNQIINTNINYNNNPSLSTNNYLKNNNYTYNINNNLNNSNINKNNNNFFQNNQNYSNYNINNVQNYNNNSEKIYINNYNNNNNYKNDNNYYNNNDYKNNNINNNNYYNNNTNKNNNNNNNNNNNIKNMYNYNDNGKIYKVNINDNNNNNQKKNNEINNNDEIKNSIIESICKNIKEPLSKKMNELKEIKEQSIAYKQIEINKGKKFLSFNLPNNLNDLNKLNQTLNENEKKLKSDIYEIKKKLIKKITIDDYENFVSVNSSVMFCSISSKTIDDFLISIKKLYEKNIISFNETKNLIRKFSRENFNLKYKRMIIRNDLKKGIEDKKFKNLLNNYIKKDNINNNNFEIKKMNQEMDNININDKNNNEINNKIINNNNNLNQDYNKINNNNFNIYNNNINDINDINNEKKKNNEISDDKNKNLNTKNRDNNLLNDDNIYNIL